MNSPTEILKKYWGFDTFRHPQENIISSVLNKKDTIALLPTGGGKSICFQIPALINNGICLVISPLIALMNDQVNNLQKKNIKAIALTSKLSKDEIIAAFDNLKYGNYKFLYLSPEKLQSELIQEKIKHLSIQLIAVDEAHCISEWGHDFRPSYLEINILRSFFPKTPIIALTASATEQVIGDIEKYLELKTPTLFKKSFFRNNLAYQVFDVDDKLFKVAQILEKISGPKIIYTNTRRATVEISNQLSTMRYSTTFYHGGMSYDDKSKSFENWLSEKIPIMVATNAFGMGIDKANVRAVIHLNLPQSIENFMQEAGRGGRDGKKAFAVVLKNKSDLFDTKNRIKKTLATVDFIKNMYFKLNQHFQIAKGEILEKKYPFNLTDFCTRYKLPIVTCYNGLKILEHEGILLLDENINRKSTVKFITSSNVVFDYCDQNSQYERLIKLLLRTYGGIFESSKVINEKYLSTSLNISKQKLKTNLSHLHSSEIIQFYNANDSSQIVFLTPRDDDRTINTIAKNIEKRNAQKLLKMEQLILFIENNEECRSVQLLSYFGENKTDSCGICDVCISKKNNLQEIEPSLLANKITQLLQQDKALSSKEIEANFNTSEDDILFCLKILLEKNILSVNSQNKYMLN